VRGNFADELSSLVTELRKEKRKKVASLVHNDKARAVEASRRGQHLLAHDTETTACQNTFERLWRAAAVGEQAEQQGNTAVGLLLQSDSTSFLLFFSQFLVVTQRSPNTKVVRLYAIFNIALIIIL
jgi:antitoxin component of MazEF toxin-antitoxin module